MYHAPDQALQEFQELADSAGVDVLTVMTTNNPEPQPKYLVGTGKANEIQQQVEADKADVVFFNHELTPAQGRNLEKLFNCRVLDRTELILDIFAQRAHTFEGKLQVELAQLQHLKTCLVRGWTHLERQKGGIGLRGPGETQLESDRRMVDTRIRSIRKSLTKVMKQREQQRRSRHRASIPTISLVGYTNAGKSTVFNQLTESSVYVADQLFATLDPTLRHLQLPQVGKVVLADTVGFIRELPHDLVAAFRATLEETRQADLLLHVVDCHQPEAKEFIHDVHSVLKEIEADKVPELLVYNKVDLMPRFSPRIDRGDDGLPRRVWISAATGDGMEELSLALQELLRSQIISTEITLDHDQGKLRAQLYELGVVKEEKHEEDGRLTLLVEMQRSDYDRLVE